MNRGQAAIEQLGTFGWSMIVVLSIIAALTYFGAFDADRFIPEECRMASGVYCIDHQSATDGITVVLENSIGFNIINLTLNIEGNNCTTAAIGPASLLNGEQGTYAFNCTPPRGAFQGSLLLNYTSQPTARTHEIIGFISSRIN